MTRTHRALVVAILVVGCGAPPAAPPPLPEAGSVSLEGVEGPIAGRLGGEAFEAADARFRGVTHPGRERVDLLFDEQPIARCGLPLSHAGTRLWLRVPGVTSLEVGEHALLDEDARHAEGAIEVHYERAEGRGWAEAHRAVARLEITSAGPERVEGRLHVCFADAAGSCVAGSFRASPCRSRIDGRALREPPGLVDEALEPLGDAPP